MESPAQALQPGEKFGRYRLLQLLAEGGMAEIFLAEQREGDFAKLVALKRMLPHLCRQPEFVSMFLDEVRLASRFSHPNVIQVFDFGEVDGRYYLAMEYLAGENLGVIVRQALVAGKPVPLPIAAQIMIAACDGLHYAHEYAEKGRPQQVVHRDISPSNIMVTAQGGVKVLDFGIARAADRRQEQTEAGVVKGKIAYSAPEQVQGQHLDRRTDVFALGAVFYELLTGARAFKRETDLKTCMAVIHDPVPPPSASRFDVPRAVDEILERALAKDPNTRYPTAQQMRRDIEKLLSGPPPRIDEYMVELFGSERILERAQPTSASGKAITVADAARPPSNSDLLGSAGAPAEDRTFALTEGVTVATTPSRPAVAVTAPPKTSVTVASSPSVPVVPDPAPRRRTRRVALSVAAGAALLAAVAGTATFLRPSSSPPAPKAASPAVLRVDTQPRGAQVRVGGSAVDGTTPLVTPGLSPGEWVVEASLPGHRSASQRVVLADGEERSVVMTLEALPTRLEVAAPPQARLLVDGRDLGSARSADVVPGVHKVKVVARGFAPFEQTIELAAGESRRVEARLEPLAVVARPKPAPAAAVPGKLDVTCVPWCRVFVDGQDLGKPSPIVGHPLPPGRHQLRMEHPPTGRSKEVILEIASGATTRQVGNFR